METTPYYARGKENKYVCVFSCPGRYEEMAGYPVAKTTGKNLERLFCALNAQLQTEDFSREKVTITNSWTRVEYKEKTGRSEADSREILEQTNLDRLCQDLKIAEKAIFCFGDKAKLAVDALKEENRLPQNVKVVYARHMGMRGINSIKYDRFGKEIVPSLKSGLTDQNEIKKWQNKNTNKRIEVIAAELIKQLEES